MAAVSIFENHASLFSSKAKDEVEVLKAKTEIVREVRETARELKEAAEAVERICDRADQSALQFYKQLVENGAKEPDAREFCDRVLQRRYDVIDKACFSASSPKELAARMERVIDATNENSARK